jgi:hypothetical protein
MKVLIVTVLALSSTLALAQRGGNAVSRSASPTGTRDQGRAERTADFSMKDARKLSPLLEITPEQLVSEYGHDRRTCNVRPNTYVALRLAQKQNELAPEHTTQTVLQNMCAKKTHSFAFSLNKSAQDQKAEQKNLLVVEQKLHEK